ncbi:aquaporin [Actinoplanes sp. NBRC 14428]|uniref:Aquaporin Z n=1 Tax=Pseudosporangium ferrugineum TaxID=439699 RepID=A0A2T0RJM9_9ACTN|nr:aquaporin [Pseudosporangium ferrugineum]PRY21368.1 aquaporin Z [Pseudosporangium ferrugineum]BCJ56069.1 aquaporin [Actinoplanes sp. NBRC 14428]
MRRYAVEAIGTFFLVLVITTTVLLNVGPAPFAIAAVLAVMVFAGGHLSGAHYNPAVTVALAVRNRFAWRDVPAYCAAQTAGALGGALVGRYVLVGQPAGQAFHADGRALAAAAVAELLVTFALAYVVLNVATSKRTAGNSFYGLAIGGTVLVGALTVGGISGGVFNPAVAVGVATAGLLDWTLVPAYLVCQIAAGALAGLAFRALNPDDVAEPAVEEPAAAPAVDAQLAHVLTSIDALTTAFRNEPGERDTTPAEGGALARSIH